MADDTITVIMPGLDGETTEAKIERDFLEEAMESDSIDELAGGE